MHPTHSAAPAARPMRERPISIAIEMTEERLVTYALERAQRHVVAGEPIADTLARADAIEAWLRGKLNPSAPAG